MTRRRTAPRLFALAVLAAVLVPLVGAGQAQAQPNLFSVMMDDDALVYRDDATRDRAMRRMKEAGVDVVRVTLLWSVVAENARRTKALDKRFRRLKASNPKAYPKLNWDRYDRLVRAARVLGLKVYFNVTGPGPAWGHAKAPASERANRFTWKPKPKEFYRFVQAVGKRFSGTFRDENDGRRILPTVDIWSIWNEPNQAGWLSPQFDANGQPVSPHLYRDLYDHGYRALLSTGHGKDAIMIGETAPNSVEGKGRDSRAPMAAKEFIREFFCVDANVQPLTGAAATSRKCEFWDRKGKVDATWFAHHPYTKNVSPTARDANPDAITMANIGELPALLDQVGQNTGRVRVGMNVLSSEFGFETNPPDPFSGVPFERQSFWNNLGELQAFLNPRIVGQSQFLLYDVLPRRKNKTGSKAYWSTYQSGLITAGGQEKPAMKSYYFPFIVIPTGSFDPNSGRPTVSIWGGLRFRPEGVEDVFTLEFKPADGSSDWVPFGEPVKTNQPIQLAPDQPPVEITEGYFFLQGVVPPGPGQIRAKWEGPQAPFKYTSPEFDVQ